jgi:hypothetical protein
MTAVSNLSRLSSLQNTNHCLAVAMVTPGYSATSNTDIKTLMRQPCGWSSSLYVTSTSLRAITHHVKTYRTLRGTNYYYYYYYYYYIFCFPKYINIYT